MASAVVRVGVGVLVTSKLHPGCILLGTRLGSHGAGKLAAPGGHLELSESWAECAAREVKEETNLDIENISNVFVTNDPNIGNNPLKHYITIFMTGEVSANSTELINMEPNKCSGWNWIDWAELINIRETSEATLFEPMLHLIDGLKANNKTFL